MDVQETPFKTVVVGTDFSRSARSAFTYAQDLSSQSNARLDVIHVIEPLGDNPLIEAFRSAVDDVEVARRLLAESDRRMEEFVSGHDIPRSRLRCIHARSNDVSQTLIQYAESLEADALVVGTRGHRAIRTLFLGSTASRVLELATMPVVVVPEPGDTPVIDNGGVLVPLDLSDASRKGLLEARKLARLFRAEMHVLHVLEPYALPVSLTGIRGIRDLVPDILDRVRTQLEEMVQTLEGSYVPYSIHVREGGAAIEIIDMAREIGARAIAMSARGFSKGDRFLMGSVAERVFRHAPCPVFVTPSTDTMSGHNGTAEDQREQVI